MSKKVTTPSTVILHYLHGEKIAQEIFQAMVELQPEYKNYDNYKRLSLKNDQISFIAVELCKKK